MVEVAGKVTEKLLEGRPIRKAGPELATRNTKRRPGDGAIEAIGRKILLKKNRVSYHSDRAAHDGHPADERSRSVGACRRSHKLKVHDLRGAESLAVYPAVGSILGDTGSLGGGEWDVCLRRGREDGGAVPPADAFRDVGHRAALFKGAIFALQANLRVLPQSIGRGEEGALLLLKIINRPVFGVLPKGIDADREFSSRLPHIGGNAVVGP